MTITTVQDAELTIKTALESLRGVPFNETVSTALSFLLPPEGYRLSVQMEEDGRKKRNTASIANWNHTSGEIVLFYEPIAGSGVLHTSTPPAVLPPTARTETSLTRPVIDAAGRQPIASQPAAATALPAAVPIEQELRECCQALAEAEKMGRQFYAIKWFRDTYLPERDYAWTASLQERQRVLNRAIQDGFIDTQTIPNPKNPAFPTTTLQLNRDKAKGIVGSRFRPITLRGEPLSETIIRDRGER